MALSTAGANRLLHSLPGHARNRLRAISEQVSLERGATLWEASSRISHVYFPLSGFISSVVPMEEGIPDVETVSTGDEGMVGATVALGISHSAERVLVQSTVEAILVERSAFQRELAENPALAGIVQRYLFVLQTQLCQNIACAHHHVLERRFARWLLVAQDRCHSDEFFLTQEFIANMLGVHRPAVSAAVRLMQQRGLITHSRGIIHITDRRALETAACPCYHSSNAIYERFMRPQPVEASIVSRQSGVTGN